MLLFVFGRISDRSPSSLVETKLQQQQYTHIYVQSYIWYTAVYVKTKWTTGTKGTTNKREQTHSNKRREGSQKESWLVKKKTKRPPGKKKGKRFLCRAHRSSLITSHTPDTLPVSLITGADRHRAGSAVPRPPAECSAITTRRMAPKMDANCKACAVEVECDVIANPDSAAGMKHKHPKQNTVERIGELSAVI